MARVKLASNWLLPVLGAPIKTARPAPCRGIRSPPARLPAALPCSSSFLTLLIFCFSSALSLSVPLCLGSSRSITCRHSSSSSGDVARRYACFGFQVLRSQIGRHDELPHEKLGTCWKPRHELRCGLK